MIIIIGFRSGIASPDKPDRDDKAKQINILGSRQHPAEKVALWCDFFFFFFFFKRGQIAGYSYAYKYIFNGV